MKPSGYDIMWIIEDFEKYIARELDFEIEASSGEATAVQLAHLSPSVFIPKVFREFSTQRVLIMEFVDGLIKANDRGGLVAAGLDVDECVSLLLDTLSEMIFLHGRVH